MGIGERTTKTSDSDRTCFYRAALAALRYADHRRPTGRRFGPDADARWAGFRRYLANADRIDLLLRDADRSPPGNCGGASTPRRRPPTSGPRPSRARGTSRSSPRPPS